MKRAQKNNGKSSIRRPDPHKDRLDQLRWNKNSVQFCEQTIYYEFFDILI
jgi:hypothetical protein